MRKKLTEDQKREIMELNSQLRQGDKRLIAEVTGYHEKHIINTLNQKITHMPSAENILRVVGMLIDNRREFIEKVKHELISKTE